MSNIILKSTFYITISPAISSSQQFPREASTHTDLGNLNSIGVGFDSYLAKYVTINLKKTSCKQFYKLFAKKLNAEPTAFKSWQKNCPEGADNWMHCMQSNYKITWDNKLRQFCFKLLHRIVVTNKELKRFGITDDRKCVMCSENDSIEHAFYECQSFKKLCDESLQWFNNAKQTCYIRIYIQVNKSHNRTERESKGVGLDILISKKLFFELCGPRGNSFR